MNQGGVGVNQQVVVVACQVALKLAVPLLAIEPATKSI